MNFRSALAALCLSLAACSGMDVPPPQPMPLPNPLTGSCAGLDEGACNAAPSCVAIYGYGEEPQPVPVVGLVSGCMPFEPEQPVPFHHCEEMAPADPCAGLDEATCTSTAGCQALYVGGGIEVDPSADPVDAAFVGYAGCATAPVLDACAGLDEVTCTNTPGCEALYVGGGLVPGSEDGSTGTTAVVGFAGCASVSGGEEPPSPPTGICPAVACLIYCEHGEVVDANGCSTCECLP